MTAKNRCANCIHYYKSDDYSGTCRKYPPQNVGVYSNRDTFNEDEEQVHRLRTTFAFPDVMPTDGCSQHEISGYVRPSSEDSPIDGMMGQIASPPPSDSSN